MFLLPTAPIYTGQRLSPPHMNAPVRNGEKSRQIQLEEVITLQQRKIQELEARLLEIKETGHAFKENPVTAGELEEAQARLKALKFQTEQQASNIVKVKSDLEAAEKQLKERPNTQTMPQSLSSGGLADENTRIMKENDFLMRQVEIKTKHVTELKYQIDQLKKEYESAEQLALHEGRALRGTLEQKEAALARLRLRIQQVEKEIANTDHLLHQDTDKVEQMRYREMQARRLNEAITHVKDLEQKLQGQRGEYAKKVDLYEQKQKQLSDARIEITSMNFEVKDPHKMRAGSSEEPAYRTSMSLPKMRSRTELIVTIESARHLPKMDVMGTCDTCCVVAWQGQEYKTTVKEKSYSPDWNETFAFPVENISIGSLSVVVMDWDMVSKNDVIGEVVIPGDTLQAFWQGNHTATVEDSFAVLNKGKAVIGNDNEPCVLNLKMRLAVTHEEMSPPLTVMQQAQGLLSPWKLRLGLIKAQHLPQHLHSAHLGLIKTTDPFVTFDIPGQQEQRSKIIINTLNPEWNEEFLFDVHDEKQELVLRVFYWSEDSKNDFIGEVRLKLSDLSSLLNSKLDYSSNSIQVIMNEGRPVIGTDSETATVTLFLSASTTMKRGVEAVGVAPADPNLPPPWTTHVSTQTGNPYWYNRETKETTWTRPVKQPESLLKSRAAREDELNEQVTNMRQELDQAAEQRKLIQEGRKHVDQQNEILKHAAAQNGTELREVAPLPRPAHELLEAVACYGYQSEHEDEMDLNVGDKLILIEAAQDPGWFYAAKVSSGERGMVPITHIKINN